MVKILISNALTFLVIVRIKLIITVLRKNGMNIFLSKLRLELNSFEYC